MDTQTLKDRIKLLLDELESGDASNAELRSKLQALDSDIHVLLERPGDATLDVASLGDRAREMSIEFAGRHPRLEPVLAELANMLASIGI